MTLADGLYRVTHGTLCAGFVVQGGRVTRCAPILWKRIGYWVNKAEKVAMGGDELKPFRVFCLTPVTEVRGKGKKKKRSVVGYSETDIDLESGETLMVEVGRMLLAIKPTNDGKGVRIVERGTRRLLMIPEVSNSIQVRSREDEGEF